MLGKDTFGLLILTELEDPKGNQNLRFGWNIQDPRGIALQEGRVMDVCNNTNSKGYLLNSYCMPATIGSSLLLPVLSPLEGKHHYHPPFQETEVRNLKEA